MEKVLCLRIAEVVHAAVAAQVKVEGRVPRPWEMMTQEQKNGEAAWVCATIEKLENKEVIATPRTISEALTVAIVRCYVGESFSTPQIGMSESVTQEVITPGTVIK